MGQSNTITSYVAPSNPASANVSARKQTPSTHTPKLLDTVLNSITISLVEAPWWIAMLALVFTGSLAPYLGQAAVFLMAGSVISMTIVSSLCSWKGCIWIPQDVPTAILVVATAEIVRKVTADASIDTVFVTVIVSIGLASVITGTFLYLLGTFKLGRLVRLLPYPVLAGFLGATGCLLVLGGINNSLVNPSADQLLDFQILIRWVPTVLLALLMYTLSLYIKHALLIPAVMLTATLCFFAVTSMLGISQESLSATGWLYAALPETQQSAGITLTQFQNIQWTAIFDQAGSLVLLAVFSAIAMLLNNSGFELTVKGKFDQNKDLRATGIANIFAGLVGGWPGYMSPAWSSINARQGKQLPLTGLLTAIFTCGLLWYATQLIEMIPRFVIGSAIAYIGVTFLFDWIIEPIKRLSTMSYVSVIITMTLFVTLGVMI